jgi:hypothetical protein
MYMLLKSGTSTLIIWGTFTHFKPMVPCPCPTHTVQGCGTRDTRVEWPVSEHLSAQGRPHARGGFHCFWCSIKIWIPPIGASCALKIFKNIRELTKLQPPKLEGSRTQKTKPSNTINLVPKHPKKLLVCCSVVIGVQRLIVELKVTLL